MWCMGAFQTCASSMSCMDTNKSHALA
ncbi:hypothetical protein LINPERHAP2_LOCUS14248 [Linum perenne]